METIPELRKICQTTAHKDVTNVYMRYVCRPISIYVTRFLIPTAVTADQVSLAMILTGLVANLFFLSPYRFLFLMGTLILQCWYLLDCVDGEVARYRSYQKNQKVIEDKLDLDMTGAYWDYLNHYIVHGFVPLTASFGVYQATRSPLWLLIGFLASVAQTLLLAVHDTKSRAYVGKIRRALGSKWSVNLRPKTESSGAGAKKNWTALKRAFVVVHYSCTYPTVMNTATLLAFLNFVRPHSDLRGLFLNYYAWASIAVFVGIAANSLRDRSLDQKFEEEFLIERN